MRSFLDFTACTFVVPHVTAGAGLVDGLQSVMGAARQKV